MHEAIATHAVLIVRHRGELDDAATVDLVDEVRARTTSETAVIVVSLADATGVHWNALCRLARAVRFWRLRRDVVVKDARPRLRAVLASADGAA